MPLKPGCPLRMPPTPSAQGSALMLMVYLSSLLCPSIQVFSSLYSPLSEMQNNMTFVRGQYALSRKKNHDFIEGYSLSWWYENFHLLKPKATDLPSTRTLVFSRSLMIRSLESYKYVKLHLFITEELGLNLSHVIFKSFKVSLCSGLKVGCVCYSVCKCRDLLNYLRPHWEFIIEMLFVACAYFISHSP